MREQNILITGAASGMGYAIARKLAPKRQRLYCLDIDKKSLEQCCKTLQKSEEVECTPLVCDLRSPEMIENVFLEIDKLDHVIHCAGIALPDDWKESSDDDWIKILQVNLLGAWLIIHQSARALSKQSGGTIISISSAAALKPMPSQAVYSATKAGLNALHHALREELRPHNIRLTTICPGPTKTNILHQFPKEYIDKYRVMEEPRLDATDIADVVDFIITSPAHMNFDNITLTPSSWTWS